MRQFSDNLVGTRFKLQLTSQFNVSLALLYLFPGNMPPNIMALKSYVKLYPVVASFRPAPPKKLRHALRYR
jgi:hypothetical protein